MIQRFLGAFVLVSLVLVTPLTISAKTATPASNTSGVRVWLNGKNEKIDCGSQIVEWRLIETGLYRIGATDQARFVVGRVRNISNDVIVAPSLSFVLLDRDGNILGTLNAQPMADSLDFLKPGKSTVFMSGIDGNEPSFDSVASVQITASCFPADQSAVAAFKLMNASVQDVKEITRTSDTLQVQAKIVNKGKCPIIDAVLNAVISDTKGHVAGWDWQPVQATIPPGKSALVTIPPALIPQDILAVAGSDYRYVLVVTGTADPNQCSL